MSGSGANTPAHTASHMPHLCNILLMWQAWIRYWCRSCAEYSVGLGFRSDGMCFPSPLTVIPLLSFMVTLILRLGQLDIRGRKVFIFLRMFQNNIDEIVINNLHLNHTNCENGIKEFCKRCYSNNILKTSPYSFLTQM